MPFRDHQRTDSEAGYNCPTPKKKKWILILKLIAFLHKYLGITLLRLTFHWQLSGREKIWIRVLVSQGCCNKFPQTSWIKTTGIHSLSGLSSDSEVSITEPSSRLILSTAALRGALIPASSRVWGLQGSLACGHVKVIFQSVCSVHHGAFLVAQLVKNLPEVQKIWVRSLCWEDHLGKGMVTHSSILARRIPWTEEPGRLYSPWSPKELDITKQQTLSP